MGELTMVREGAGTLWLPAPRRVERARLEVPGVSELAKFYCGLEGLISNTSKAGMAAGFGSQKSYGEQANRIRLHTGNPGAEGNTNIAGEKKSKLLQLKYADLQLEKYYRWNGEALEWVEVSAKETYTYFSLWEGGTEEAPTIFLGYGEFTAPIAVEVGDTFKIKEEALTVKVE